MDREFVIKKANDWTALIPQKVGGKPFAEWLAENFHVWERFCGIAEEVWVRGRRHYSGRTIVEVIRHESAIREVSSEYKINNSAAPAMCRLYTYLRPERTGLFELREKKETA